MNTDEILKSQENAPKDNASIAVLCVRADLGKREFPHQIDLDPKQGVIGDRWIKKNWVIKADGTSDERNQVSILPKRIYDALCLSVNGAPHPGDTVIADFDCSFENLPIGSKLRMGEALLEISDVPNYGCEKWRDRYGQASWKFIAHKELRERRLRGVLCRVLTGGRVTLDDKIVKDISFS